MDELKSQTPSNIQAQAEDAAARASKAARSALHRGGEYVDGASTSVGRAMQSTADGIANRALSTSERMSRAGQYLERSTTEDLERDIGNFLRQHPGVTLGVGLGLGLLIGRALSK